MALRRSSESRRGTPSALVILGLANPGGEYEGSRHNVGGDAVRLVAERRRVAFQLESRQRCVMAHVPTSAGIVTLAVPTTFMNESGAAVPPLMRRTSLPSLEALVVVHDELDLDAGRLRLKMGGGIAGHNGLRSIVQATSSSDFARLRIGIGRPIHKEQVTDWVLRRPTGERRRELGEHVALAADAIELIIDSGFDEAQRRVNAGRE